MSNLYSSTQELRDGKSVSILYKNNQIYLCLIKKNNTVLSKHEKRIANKIKRNKKVWMIISALRLKNE